MMFSLADVETAERIVYAAMPPTPQYAWPLLAREMGCEIWVKHENHTPVGAFKIRGGLVHMHMRKQRGETRGVITATRGNHGQSIPFAARRHGIAATVVVPLGNSVEKNAAMRALGADLIETGSDFDEARQTAIRLAAERGLDMVASFQPELVLGVSTYAKELFREAGELDAVYVPIGLGSGICGVIRMRDLLGLRTRVIGVVAENAPAYTQSYAAGRVIASNSSATFADGVAVRVPDPEALAIIKAGADRIVSISESAIAEAVRTLYRTTHNLAEGAGAIALAAVAAERETLAGKRVGVIMSGGNIDMNRAATILAGATPNP
jgi:threonine dehydratase